MAPHQGVSDALRGGVTPYAPPLLEESPALRTRSTSDGMSSAAQLYIDIGVIVGCVVVVGVVVLLIYVACVRRRKRGERALRGHNGDSEIRSGPEMAQMFQHPNLSQPRSLVPSPAQEEWDALRSSNAPAAPPPKRPSSARSHSKRFRHLSAILESPKTAFAAPPPDKRDTEDALARVMGFSKPIGLDNSQAGHRPSDLAISLGSPKSKSSSSAMQTVDWDVSDVSTLYDDGVREASHNELPSVPEDVVFGQTARYHPSLGRASHTQSIAPSYHQQTVGPAPNLQCDSSVADRNFTSSARGSYFAHVPHTRQESIDSMGLGNYTKSIIWEDENKVSAPAVEDVITPGSECSIGPYFSRNWQPPPRNGSRQPFNRSSTNLDKYRSFSRHHISRPSGDSGFSRPCSMMTTASIDTSFSIPQIAVADRVCISRVPARDTAGDSSVHQITTTHRPPGRPNLVSSDGSPAERKKAYNHANDSCMEELRPRTASPSRRSSVSSEDSTWSNEAPSVRTNRSFRSARTAHSHRRTASGKKIYRRRPGPRLVNAAPRSYFGPRPVSSVFMDEILEEVEGDETSPRKRAYHRHLNSNSRRISRASSSSSFAHNLQRRLLRASVSSTSTSMAAWALFQRQGFVTPSMENPPSQLPKPDNRLSKQSVCSRVTIPEFPTPSRSGSIPTELEHPVPHFSLTLPPPKADRIRSLEPKPLSIPRKAKTANTDASAPSRAVPMAARIQDCDPARMTSTMGSRPDIWAPTDGHGVSPMSLPFSPENHYRIPPGTPDSWTALMQHVAAAETPTRAGSQRKFEKSPVLGLSDPGTFAFPNSDAMEKMRHEEVLPTYVSPHHQDDVNAAAKQQKPVHSLPKQSLPRHTSAGVSDPTSIPGSLRIFPNKSNVPTSQTERTLLARKPSKGKAMLQQAMSLGRKSSAASKQRSTATRFLGRLNPENTPTDSAHASPVSDLTVVPKNDFDFGFHEDITVSTLESPLPPQPPVSKIPMPSPKLAKTRRVREQQGSDSCGFGLAGGAEVTPIKTSNSSSTAAPSPLSPPPSRNVSNPRRATDGDAQAWWAPIPNPTPITKAFAGQLHPGPSQPLDSISTIPRRASANTAAAASPPSPLSRGSPTSPRRYYSQGPSGFAHPTQAVPPVLPAHVAWDYSHPSLTSTTLPASLPPMPAPLTKSKSKSKPKSRLPVRKSSRDAGPPGNMYDADGFLRL